VTYPLGGFRMISGQRSEDYKSYLKEAKAALDTARQKLNWSDKDTNGLIYSQLCSIPRVGAFLKSHYGYKGSYVYKKDMKSTNSLWSIEQKIFLP
jgi:hypothetical protein